MFLGQTSLPVVCHASLLAVAGLGLEHVDQIDDVEEPAASRIADPGPGNGDGQVGLSSPVAELIFALELDRRSRASGSSVSSLAAHPGISATEQTRHIGRVPEGISFMSAADGAIGWAQMEPQRAAGASLNANVQTL